MIWFGYGTLLCHQVGWPPYIDMTLILGTRKATPLKMLPTWNSKMATTQTSSRSIYIYMYIYHRPDISRYMISDIDILVSGSLNSHQSFILAVWQQPFSAYVRSIFHRYQLILPEKRASKAPPPIPNKSQGLSLHCHCPDPAGSLWWTWQTSVWFPCGRNHGLPSERRISRAYPWHTASSSTNSFRFEHWLSWLLWNLSGA